MNFLIVILALVSTQTLYVVNAESYVFGQVRVQDAVAPENDVFTLDPGPSRDFVYKQDINQLLINATVTYLGSGDVLYNGQLVNICDNQEANSWPNAVVKFFKFILVPRKKKGSPVCPIKRTHGQLAEQFAEYHVSLDDKLDSGAYQFSYTAQTDNNTVILTSLIVTMSLP